MFPYFTVEELSVKSGLTPDQVLRLGMSGEIIFSVLEHIPRNYEEINEAENEEGQTIIHTKTNETTISIGNFPMGLQLRYIRTEDFINIVTNDAPNRKTLVRFLFKTREFEPENGKWLVNDPMRVSLADVVITSEEWERFAAGKGKDLKKHIPLALPENITFAWLWQNLSIGMWIKVVILCTSIFSAGAFFAQSSLYTKLDSLLSKASSHENIPKK